MGRNINARNFSSIFVPSKKIMQDNTNWFKIWFDSPYYHLLYRHRDFPEATAFVKHLIDELNLPPGSRVLDMGCGQGRHCIQLHDMGFEVVGMDLSAANVDAANIHRDLDLEFIQHDMREPLQGEKFDLVLNLFTSFGYFENVAANQQVLEAAASMLRHGGRFVLDFLNARKVIRELTPIETREVEETRFDISRKLVNGIIIKNIQVNQNPELQFEERVQALEKDELFQLFRLAGLEPESTYGSYDFKPFNPESSDRLIIIASLK